MLPWPGSQRRSEEFAGSEGKVLPPLGTGFPSEGSDSEDHNSGVDAGGQP